MICCFSHKSAYSSHRRIHPLCRMCVAIPLAAR